MSETTAEQTAEATEAKQVSTDTATGQKSEQTTEKVDGEDALGDKGKKALDAMKAERNQFREQNKSLETALAEMQAKIDGKEAEHKAEQAKREAEQAALDKANGRILKAEVRAAAAGKLSDPTDALRFIDLSSFEVGDDGEVDADAISSAITDLISTKPYLAVQDGKRFQGDPDAGARKEARPSQLSQSDLDRMTPEQIVAARKEGRCDDLLGVKR